MLKITWVLLLLGIAMPLRAQDPALAQAQAQKIEAATLRGDLVALIDCMHPRFRERLARRVGGDEALLERIKKQQKQLLKSGARVEAFTVKPATSLPVRVQFGREYLVFLPTLKQISVVDPEGKVHRLEQKSFLVAVTPAGKDEWKFIDGASVSQSDLRSLFPELKKDFESPPVETKEVK